MTTAAASGQRSERRDLREVLGGLLVALFGLAFLVPSFGYGIGRLTAMEAGLYPMGTAILTIVIGVGLVADGLRRRDPDAAEEHVSWRPLLAVSAGIAGFALVVDRFGFVAAVIAAVVLSALGDSDSRPFGTAVLAAVLCVAVWLVFSLGLAMPMQAFRF